MIKIEPIDTLFFRDGKPFSMGDQSTAFGIFPPYPGTIFGAIRTGFISQNQGFAHFLDGKLADEIGTPEESSSAAFKLKGVFLYNSTGDYLYLPAPLDLFTEDNKKAKRTEIKELPPFLTNLYYDRFPFAIEMEKAQRVNGYYVLHTSFSAYLNGSETEFDIYPESSFCQIEYKTGIKINPRTKTVEEGNLYRVGMRRFKRDWMLACDFEGVPSLQNEGILKLGGEGKMVHYETISSQLPEDRESVLERIKQTGQIKLYLATPALFKNGWLPDEEIFNGPDYRLELLTASIGSPLSVGGWDMAKNGGKGGHKPMMRAVPAGSVYYFRIEAGDPENIYERFHYHNLSQRAHEGFGLALVGGV